MSEAGKVNTGEQAKRSDIWLKVLNAALSLPGARVNRAAYLKKQLSKHFPQETVDKAIATTPAKAGIPSSVIRSISKSSIKWHRAGVTAVSTVVSLPGKWWLTGTIPADLAQFFYHVIVIIQKLAYLHGWPEFHEEDGQPDDETQYLFTLFVGVMLGIGSAAKILSELAERVAGQVLKRLPQKALTKWGFYRLAKDVAKWIGIRLTKQSFARVMSKVVPILSGFISGTVTWIWFSRMSRRLHDHLETLRPHWDSEEVNTHNSDESAKISEVPESETTSQPAIAKNLITANKGLTDESSWAECLDGYPTELLSEIRHRLLSNIDELEEKFNSKSRYFGYSRAASSDVMYIYAQKKHLRIDLNISRENEDFLRESGFTVKYVNNFQGRAGWLTGWQVPHDTQDIDIVASWVLKAFEQD